MKFSLTLALVIGAASLSPAAIIGTNVPAEPVTAERITRLPWPQRRAWKAYLAHSAKQLRADQDFIRKEMQENGVQQATNAPLARSSWGIPLNQTSAWYTGAPARRIADFVVSYQTPAGGWSKSLDMTRHERVPGELFTTDNSSRFLTSADFDNPQDMRWNYVGTFDNDATTTQLRYLAKVIAALPAESNAKYRAAFQRGLDYILAAQYPNGGWPQVWPLQGGYHDAITFNDDAMIGVMKLLLEISEGRNEFAFVPKQSRKRAAASLKRGINCILAAQILVNGQRTVWCQQHDALTLKPASARNYEMPSLGGAESARVLIFLMELPDPSPQTVAAVHAAAEWFEKAAIYDFAFRYDGTNGRVFMPAPGAGPIWPRYSDISTGQPIFGDRDKSIHDQVNEISRERRRGYAWYGNWAERALDYYRDWSKKHP